MGPLNRYDAFLLDAPIEGSPDSDGDRQVIVIDDDNCGLHELFYARPISGGDS